MSTDPLNKYHIPNLKLVDSCLRLSVLPLSIASIWLTVTDYEDNSSYGALGFTDLTGVKYMVCISFISAIYALGAAISSWITCLVSRAWFFFVSDQLVAYLMVTSTAAVAEILYLSYNGDKEVTWSEACSSYGKFCSRLKLALVFHGLVLCFFFVLAVMSAFRAFSVYEAPHTDDPKRVVEEESANE
ncbi:hypothetical protein QQ045_017295 [Rhodiola kirilowii]